MQASEARAEGAVRVARPSLNPLEGWGWSELTAFALVAWPLGWGASGVLLGFAAAGLLRRARG